MVSHDIQGRSCLAIVLAAGDGTRMCSSQPKVLHKIAGRSMLGHVLDALAGAEIDGISVVISPGHDAVAAEAKAAAPGCEIAIQAQRLGTAHAALAAQSAIEKGYDDILIVFADTPLMRPQTFIAMRKTLAAGGNAVAALGFEAREPQGYGRLILKDGELLAIREDRDASAEEREIKMCSAGLMALDGRRALFLLGAIGNANSQGEYYLTDAVAVARAQGLKAAALIASEEEVMGVNGREQLAAAESLMQARLRRDAMRNGATLIDPASVTLAFDTRLARDVIVEPYVVFGPGVTADEGAHIRSFTYLEGAAIGQNAVVGPFTRFRPGAAIAEDARIGNFVEVKASQVGPGAKINHLSYIGDARIGAKTNVGAGTVICNYDGFGKYRTEIGESAFIGSNSALVAPVKVGAGAYIASGSVITEDVAADALAVARSRPVEKPGWAKAFRERKLQERGASKDRHGEREGQMPAGGKDNI